MFEILLQGVHPSDEIAPLPSSSLLSVIFPSSLAATPPAHQPPLSVCSGYLDPLLKYQSLCQITLMLLKMVLSHKSTDTKYKLGSIFLCEKVGVLDFQEKKKNHIPRSLRSMVRRKIYPQNCEEGTRNPYAGLILNIKLKKLRSHCLVSAQPFVFLQLSMWASS